jgi:hypothetical protein
VPRPERTAKKNSSPERVGEGRARHSGAAFVFLLSAALPFYSEP